MPLWLMIVLGVWGLWITLILWVIAANVRNCVMWLAVIAHKRG